MGFTNIIICSIVGPIGEYLVTLALTLHHSRCVALLAYTLFQSFSTLFANDTLGSIYTPDCYHFNVPLYSGSTFFMSIYIGYDSTKVVKMLWSRAKVNKHCDQPTIRTSS